VLTASRRHPDSAEVIIAGAGTVGLCLAVALKRFAPSIEVQVVAGSGVPAADERASAVAAAASRMLDRLGVWEAVAHEAQPIMEMIITDSRTGDVVRPVYLTFAADDTGAPFAYMVANSVLHGALRAAAADAGAQILDGRRVANFSVEDGAVRVRLDDRTSVMGQLLVAADGAASPLRSLAGIPTVDFRYGQSGIVATVAHERPHHGRAVEHFLPDGPFAILPLTGNRSSLVWTEPTPVAERLIGTDDAVFQDELERRFGHRLGALTLEGGRAAYPLGLSLARRFVKPRFALAGDAAHSIHPIAGQGLNLGFKDVAALAETIVETARLGLDLGSLASLERYERWRRADTLVMGLVTDTLNRLFSNDVTPLRVIRDIGLGLVDRMPELKRFFIRQAAGGGAGDMPRLLRGEPL
jgi:2-octaprenyl-6-methoxyphenol hydroxylase